MSTNFFHSIQRQQDVKELSCHFEMSMGPVRGLVPQSDTIVTITIRIYILKGSEYGVTQSWLLDFWCYKHQTMNRVQKSDNLNKNV